ncbi:MAG: TetR/AcrR family transcriptional regulator [Candidatus Heimdallarchaeaceae archaeon]
MSMKDLPLRERKYALTKFAILDAVIEKLHDKPLSEIPVSEICNEVPISEVTFYNYFPKKSDLVNYFMQLWSIDLLWHIKKQKIKSGLSVIAEIFEYNAKVVEESPNIMAEILIMIAHRRQEIIFKELQRAERLLFAAKIKCPEEIQERDLHEIILPNLKIACDKKELPKKVDLKKVFLSLLSILYGVPMSILYTTYTDVHKKIQSLYRTQLQNLWQALRLNAD